MIAAIRSKLGPRVPGRATLNHMHCVPLPCVVVESIVDALIASLNVTLTLLHGHMFDAKLVGHVELEEKRKAIEANPPPVKKARGRWRCPEVLEFLASL